MSEVNVKGLAGRAGSVQEIKRVHSVWGPRGELEGDLSAWWGRGGGGEKREGP